MRVNVRFTTVAREGNVNKECAGVWCSDRQQRSEYAVLNVSVETVMHYLSCYTTLAMVSLNQKDGIPIIGNTLC